MSSSRGTEPGRSGFWRCAAFQTAIGVAGGGVHAYPAKALAKGVASFLPASAVSCGIGAAEGAVAGTAYLLPDQDTELTPTVVGAALGCATADIIGSRAQTRTTVSGPFRAVEPDEIADLASSGQFRVGEWQQVWEAPRCRD